MPIPEFIAELRRAVGHSPLWLPGATAVIWRGEPGDEELLLVRRADDGAWSSICGIVDPGEEPGDAAVREAAEEAGVSVEIERLVWMSVTDMVTYDNGDQTQYIDHTFRCRWLGGDPYPADGEASEVGWFHRTQLPDMPRVHAERVAIALANEPECRLGRVA